MKACILNVLERIVAVCKLFRSAIKLYFIPKNPNHQNEDLLLIRQVDVQFSETLSRLRAGLERSVLFEW